MDVLIKNCAIISGDGKTILENAWIGIKNDKIVAVSQDKVPDCILNDTQCKIIDAQNCYAIPGVINTHTHGCSIGPLYSSGATPPELSKALRNADRHLQQGTCSLINVCGLGSFDETERVNQLHPLKIHMGTAHFPSSFKAAAIIDAKGLKKEHYSITAKEILNLGAVLVGEIGSGATLGGGVSEYKYIPEAIYKKCGILLSEMQVHAMKQAFLTFQSSETTITGRELPELITEYGLGGKVSTDEIVEIFDFYTNHSINTSLASFDEAFEFAEKHSMPIIFHNSSVSAAKIFELSQKMKKSKIIAAHSNHTSFNLDECLRWTRKLKANGVIIDVASINSFSGYNIRSIQNIEALLAENLVDIFSTDYGGGVWDSILEMIQYFCKRNLLDLKKGINMVSGAIPIIFGKPFSNLGLIQEGKTADITIADKLNLAKVEYVLIDGKIVVDGAFRVYKKQEEL